MKTPNNATDVDIVPLPVAPLTPNRPDWLKILGHISCQTKKKEYPKKCIEKLRAGLEFHTCHSSPSPPVTFFNASFSLR